MSTLPPSRSAAARGLVLGTALAGLVAGCQALGGGGGVMPDTQVGLPPSLRGALPNREPHNAGVDADGRPLQTAPTRQLALPKSTGAGARTADASERRIRREDLDGGNGAVSGGGSGGSMGPMMAPGGSVGLGGKF
ncbi:hypothetical protein ACLBX9_19100 [Methylobacterium sp. A49B]|uniref:Uncharacterized protein n=1 Tax=Methylobacterium mesophilicum SR1.6/6 TaxID=908290 RepID=A0A6B9FUR7_9HYPH|nr:hypothetical protein [Methylobacterium mesophilicum]QGY05772.1 hypothetical protein MMSR116_30645 [Methylobacterium mesophilicum SR1.6/6]